MSAVSATQAKATRAQKARSWFQTAPVCPKYSIATTTNATGPVWNASTGTTLLRTRTCASLPYHIAWTRRARGRASTARVTTWKSPMTCAVRQSKTAKSRLPPAQEVACKSAMKTRLRTPMTSASTSSNTVRTNTTTGRATSAKTGTKSPQTTTGCVSPNNRSARSISNPGTAKLAAKTTF